MIVFSFFIFIFIVCWLVLLVNRVTTFRNKSKLSIAIKTRHLGIRRNLSVFEDRVSKNFFKTSLKSYLKMILSFGSKEKAKAVINNFIDVKAIENSSDLETKKLISRWIKLERIYLKIWIIMIGSLILALLTKMIWIN